jgi:hypothetical protein
MLSLHCCCHCSRPSEAQAQWARLDSGTLAVAVGQEGSALAAQARCTCLSGLVTQLQTQVWPFVAAHTTAHAAAAGASEGVLPAGAHCSPVRARPVAALHAGSPEILQYPAAAAASSMAVRQQEQPPGSPLDMVARAMHTAHTPRHAQSPATCNWQQGCEVGMQAPGALPAPCHTPGPSPCRAAAQPLNSMVQGLQAQMVRLQQQLCAAQLQVQQQCGTRSVPAPGGASSRAAAAGPQRLSRQPAAGVPSPVRASRRRCHGYDKAGVSSSACCDVYASECHGASSDASSAEGGNSDVAGPAAACRASRRRPHSRRSGVSAAAEQVRGPRSSAASLAAMASVTLKKLEALAAADNDGAGW